MKKRKLIGYSIAAFEGPFIVTIDRWNIYKRSEAQKLAKEANKTFRRNFPGVQNLKYKAVKTF